jgi:hypothetical protein
MQDRLKELGEIFAVGVGGFSAMENHLHVLLWLDPDVAKGWSDDEVARDDWQARRRAEGLGIPVCGTLTFLLIARSVGRIAAVGPVPEQLRHLAKLA